MISWLNRVSNKFVNAFRGLWVVIKEEKSLWVHIFVALLVILFGVIFKLTLTEWCLIAIAIGLVIGFELFNTSIEYMVDIASYEYSVKAKKVKDVSAMATLFVTLVSIAIGLMVFIPSIQSYFA